MASAIIHMCVANEINKIIKRNNNKLLIGSIAPDISKQIGETKEKSHFLIDNIEEDIPDLKKFLNKYKNHLDDDFVLGYYIHLYTDYIWAKLFIPKLITKHHIYKLDGTIEELDENNVVKYIYNDYSNLNIRLLDEYNLDLSIFYREIPPLENIIEEIPMKNIKVIIDKMGIIIENTKINKPYIFDIEKINKFIKLSINIILKNLKELEIN